jgi:sporulation protein YlmC with PRC-barrel domain
MERTINSLIGWRMEARDGEVGKVEDIYFDDHSWTVRYLVLKIESWLSDRKVLIAPVALMQNWGKTGIFHINLTQDQICQSPGIDTEKPVSRQQEIELYGYYSWKGYWESGFYGQGVGEIKGVGDVPPGVKGQPAVDLHLRASTYVSGFHVHGIDGELGRICDFVIDDRTWKVLNLVVNTSPPPEGKKVLVAVSHIIEMRWSDSEVYLSQTKAEIESSTICSRP